MGFIEFFIELTCCYYKNYRVFSNIDKGKFLKNAGIEKSLYYTQSYILALKHLLNSKGTNFCLR